MTGFALKKGMSVVAIAAAFGMLPLSEAYADKKKTDDAIKGALIGAGVGALIGKGRGAAAGAIVGALIGANKK